MTPAWDLYYTLPNSNSPVETGLNTQVVPADWWASSAPAGAMFLYADLVDLDTGAVISSTKTLATQTAAAAAAPPTPAPAANITQPGAPEMTPPTAGLDPTTVLLLLALGAGVLWFLRNK